MVRLQFSYLFSMFVQPFNATCSSYFFCKSKFLYFLKTKLLAIILFGSELALHNVFSPPHNKFVFYITIAFILLSAYTFYLDQFEIYCVVEYKHFFTAVDNLILYINYIENCN